MALVTITAFPSPFPFRFPCVHELINCVYATRACIDLPRTAETVQCADKEDILEYLQTNCVPGNLETMHDCYLTTFLMRA